MFRAIARSATTATSKAVAEVELAPNPFHLRLADEAVAKLNVGAWEDIRLQGTHLHADLSLQALGAPVDMGMLKTALAQHGLELGAAGSPKAITVRADTQSPIGGKAFALIEERGTALADRAYAEVQRDAFEQVSGPRKQRSVVVKVGDEHPGTQELIAMNGSLQRFDLGVEHTPSTATEPSRWFASADGTVRLQATGRFSVGNREINESIKAHGEQLGRQVLTEIEQRGWPEGQTEMTVPLAGWRGVAELEAMRPTLKKAGFGLVNAAENGQAVSVRRVPISWFDSLRP